VISLNRKEKRFQRENDLLKAALDEFSSKSYEEASLNRIIKNAGMSKGSKYLKKGMSITCENVT